MQIRVGCRVFAIMTTLAATLWSAQSPGQKRPWKGYSILGNGHLTAVYSDDSRITSLTHQKGVQHLYFNDYAADYVASTAFEVRDRSGEPIEPGDTGADIGMKNFFTAQTTASLSNGSSKRVLCFVHPDDAVVLALTVNGGTGADQFRFEAILRRRSRPIPPLSHLVTRGKGCSGRGLVERNRSRDCSEE